MTEPGPVMPRVQQEYWVDGTILPFDAPANQAAVVVLDVPATAMGTIGVALRGSSARLPVQACLWTPANVMPV